MFDPANRFLKTLHVQAGEVVTASGFPLLDGGPAGEYTVVSYTNAKLGTFVPMIPGVSTPADLRLTLVEGLEYATSDPLFHCIRRFDVQRGEPRVRIVALDKLFYRLDVSVTGAQQVEKFRVAFCGAPSGIDYAGAPITDPVTYCPALQPIAGGLLGGSLLIPRFADAECVTMDLLSGERLLARMPLSDYLAQHGDRIDLTAKDVVIPIDIEVNSTDVTVTVAGWDEGSLQIPILGH